MTSKEWELYYGDMAYGGDYGDKRDNEALETIGYMYTQSISFDPSDSSIALRQIANKHNIDFESLFLHFTTDTTFNIVNEWHSKWTSIYGNPYTVGWTNSPQHSGYWAWQRQPWDSYDIKPFESWNNGGNLFVFHNEMFNGISLRISNDDFALSALCKDQSAWDDIVFYIEYPSAIDEKNKQVIEWRTHNLKTDETNKLCAFDDDDDVFKSIQWEYQSDWKRAAVYDPVIERGQYFGRPLLKEGAAMYFIKITWKPSSDMKKQLNEYAHLRGIKLNALELKRWILFNEYGNQSVVPGWDADNDLNGDGYVDDSEYDTRANNKASARFKHESRAIPLGKLWSEVSSGCRINAFNPKAGVVWKEYLHSVWNEKGLAGAYNDDMAKSVGPSDFQIVDGGFVHEYNENVPIQSDEMLDPYTNAWVDNIFTALNDGNKYKIAGNVGALNMFTSNQPWKPYLKVMNAIVREDYVSTSIGFTGYFGIAKAWEAFVLSKMNIQQLFQVQIKWPSYSKNIENNEANWAIDITTATALYYMFYVSKEISCLNVWGNHFWYGSGNTEAHNFWKEGVPKNIAYTPYNILMHDIGTPIDPRNDEDSDSIQFIKYQVKTQVPLDGYTVIGESTSNRLHHAEISDNGYLDIVPSYIYFGWQDGTWVKATNSPNDMILARKFSEGLILFRTNIWSSQLQYLLQEDIVQIELNDTYRVINYDGSLGEVVTSISLGTYQGVVLKKVVETTPTPTKRSKTKKGNKGGGKKGNNGGGKGKKGGKKKGKGGSDDDEKVLAVKSKQSLAVGVNENLNFTILTVIIIATFALLIYAQCRRKEKRIQINQDCNGYGSIPI